MNAKYIKAQHPYCKKKENPVYLKSMGRVTIPTDPDVVSQTLEIRNRWGADFSAEPQNRNAKIYSTHYTTRKDNAWAKTNPGKVQQCYTHAYRKRVEQSKENRICIFLKTKQFSMR